MKKLRAMKDFEWTIFLKRRRYFNYPSFYWEAHCDKFEIETRTSYNSEHHARGAWREYAKINGISKFTVL